jgi:hypothetical protein
MIETFLVALLAFLLAMVGLATGTLAGRRRLSGGCAAFRPAPDGAEVCGTCGQPADRRGCPDVARVSESEVEQK